MPAIDNDDFVSDFTPVLADFISGTSTAEEFSNAFLAIVDDWALGGISTALAMQKLTLLVTNWDTREAQFRDWVGGSATGGYEADGTTPNGGYYPMTNSLGVTAYVPCPAKVVSVTEKGDKGEAAQVGWVFEVHGKPGPSAIIGRYPVVASYTLDEAYCYGNADIAATATAVFTITKNGTSVGTITFAASGTVPTWDFTVGTTLALVRTDIIRVISPPSVDTTLSSPVFVFATAPPA